MTCRCEVAITTAAFLQCSYWACKYKQDKSPLRESPVLFGPKMPNDRRRSTVQTLSTPEELICSCCAQTLWGKRKIHWPVGRTAAAGVPVWVEETAVLSSPGQEEPSRLGGKHSALWNTPSRSSAGWKTRPHSLHHVHGHTYDTSTKARLSPHSAREWRRCLWTLCCRKTRLWAPAPLPSPWRTARCLARLYSRWPVAAGHTHANHYFNTCTSQLLS